MSEYQLGIFSIGVWVVVAVLLIIGILYLTSTPPPQKPKEPFQPFNMEKFKNDSPQRVTALRDNHSSTADLSNYKARIKWQRRNRPEDRPPEVIVADEGGCGRDCGSRSNHLSQRSSSSMAASAVSQLSAGEGRTSAAVQDTGTDVSGSSVDSCCVNVEKCSEQRYCEVLGKGP